MQLQLKCTLKGKASDHGFKTSQCVNFSPFFFSFVHYIQSLNISQCHSQRQRTINSSKLARSPSMAYPPQPFDFSPFLHAQHHVLHRSLSLKVVCTFNHQTHTPTLPNPKSQPHQTHTHAVCPLVLVVVRTEMRG